MSVSLRLYTRRLPMVRLLLPFMLGIGCQWYWLFPFSTLLCVILILTILLLISVRLPLRQRFSYSGLTGVLLHGLLAAVGALLVWKQDVRNAPDWIGLRNSGDQVLLLTLEEPLVEKPNSFKALARISEVYTKAGVERATGQVILYFKKDSSSQQLTYGSQILTGRPLQDIKNSGNPGGFDFRQYSLRQGTTHQVYLTASDYQIRPQKQEKWLKKTLFTLREGIINLIRQYIPGEQEAGLAEALLIGYKDDLDKNLVQSYSNTGVVHVIAISGLHLGIIYWLLLLLTRPLKRRSLLWLRFLFVVSDIWAFSLLAGAQPSVLRAAVMFTCIPLSTVLDRKGSVYNTLAFSAFVLLCINPFWLWDVGFQLSYLAVLSILLFYKPIYHWIFFSNRLVDFVWQLLAVSLAAQLLTLPVSIYYFHQFPVLFLLSNLVAVPLSSLILIGEILLCGFALLPSIASKLGQLLAYLIRCLNQYIERLDQVSFAVWDNLFITPLQTTLLYMMLISIAVWLLNKQVKATWLALGSLLAFMLLQRLSLIQAGKQQQLIVYNIPKQQAIDIIQGRATYFIGDTSLKQNTALWNFHVQPSRVLHRIEQENSFTQKVFSLGTKQCLVIDTTLSFHPQVSKPVIDLVILSKNPKLYLEQMAETVSVKQIVIDGSVPRWKADLWKRSAVALHIPFYDVSEKGAFVMPFESPTFAAP